jgi:Glycoside hydrolase 123 N-terminal domain/Glycoside hydrolase 123, catalytic domain
MAGEGMMRWAWRSRVLLATLGVIAMMAQGGVVRAAEPAEWHVWTETETRHVLREDPPAASRDVQVAAARNEWESFQILVRSETPITGVNVKPGDLKGPGGAVLRASGARLYRQHQLHLTTGTQRNDAFQPGWYPDALIPFAHPTTHKPLHGARFTAVPFDLPARETHGFWVDLYVPPDAKAGVYRGTYRVTGAGRRAVEVPVELTVWDFELPRVPTLVTALGSPAQRMHSYYQQRARAGKEAEPADWDAVETQCAQMLAENCLDATPPAGSLTLDRQPDGSFRLAPEKLRALRQFVDRYHVNALQLPHPDRVIKDPEAERATLNAWLAGWDRAAELARPGVTFFIYLKDEPNDAAAYAYVQRWGKAIRAAKSVARVMVVEQPWTAPGMGGADSAWGDLYGAVDIWCPLFSLFREEPAVQRQALGETIWAYTALCQGEPTPWWHTDYPLLNYRAPAWIAWRYRIRGLLYWGGMAYWTAVEDPWTQPESYRGRGVMQQGAAGRVYNGEGMLVYPGRAVGYDGIAPSIRLKALRDSVEDYEYMAILDRQGRAREAQQVVQPLAESWFRWEKDPAAYGRARAQLAAMIVAATRKAK